MATEAEIQAEALQMGWRPKEKFSGNPENFVEAEEFVNRGKQMIPFIKSQNARLHTQLQTAVTEVSGLKTQLSEAQEAIQALKDMNTTASLRTAKQTRKELLTARREAEKAENDEQVIAIDDQLQETNQAIKDAEEEVKTKGKKKETTPTPNAKESSENQPFVNPQDPQVQAWLSENDWWGVDEPRSDFALATGQRLARVKGLRGRALLNAVKEQVELHMPFEKSEEDEEVATLKSKSKVEGNKSSAGNGQGSGGTKAKKSFDSLPPEAKAGAAMFEKKLVGKDKTFKTVDEYRKNYAEKYWSGEEE